MAALRCACAWILLAAALHGECADVEAVASKNTTEADSQKAATEAAPESKTAAEADSQKAATEAAPESKKDDFQKDATVAAEELLGDLLEQFKRPELQWVNAIVAGAFGLVALYDGRRTAKAMVIAVIGVVVFFMVLSRLKWTSDYGAVLKYVAASECGVFAGYCAYNGYGGHHSSRHSSDRFKSGSTELVLGFTLGMYMFRLVQGLALHVPYLDTVAHNPWFDVVVGTMTVLLGCWAVLENLGAGRVFGFLAPFFGSSLVISVVGYAVMLACSFPAVASCLSISVPASAIDPVIEFWLMIVLPMSNKEVGIFHYLGKDLVLGKTTIQLDRILGIFFMLLVWLASAYYQLQRDAQLRGVKNKVLKERFLKQKPGEANV